MSCTECRFEPGKKYYRWNTDNRCSKTCEFGFYPDDGTRKCEECFIGCRGCTAAGDMSCSVCAYDSNTPNMRYYRWENNRCWTSCHDGFYPNDVTKRCEKCFDGCAKCSYNEGICYECLPGKVLFDEGAKTCVDKCQRKQFVDIKASSIN